MERKNVVDVTAFLLFESIGDSEVGSASDHHFMAETGSSCGDFLDMDAESCCGDDFLCDQSGIDEINGCDLKSCIVDDDDEEEEEEEGKMEEKEDEEQSEVYERWCNDGDGESGSTTFGFCKKSSDSVDSAHKDYELLNEMEKNRLFWESCLAS